MNFKLSKINLILLALLTISIMFNVLACEILKTQERLSYKIINWYQDNLLTSLIICKNCKEKNLNFDKQEAFLKISNTMEMIKCTDKEKTKINKIIFK